MIIPFNSYKSILYYSFASLCGGVENAGLENVGPVMSKMKDQISVLENAGSKMQDRKMRDRKMQDQKFYA